MTNIGRYAPQQLREIEEIEAIYKSIDEEFDYARNLISRMKRSFVISLLDEKGCERWEKMYKLQTLSSDTLEDRRFRILAHEKGDLPYTIVALENKLLQLCGEGNVSVKFDYYRNWITIKISPDSRSKYYEAAKLIKRILPCNLNMTFDISFNIHNEYIYVAHLQLADWTHEDIRTKDLTFDFLFNVHNEFIIVNHSQLSEYTHDEIRTEDLLFDTVINSNDRISYFKHNELAVYMHAEVQTKRL